jgi:hypothetical protein
MSRVANTCIAYRWAVTGLHERSILTDDVIGMGFSVALVPTTLLR